jgi:hypothetical protein
MGAKVIKNYELRITNDEVVAQRAIKRGDSKNSILRGRLQNAPTQRTLKMIDYQVYRIFQSFLPVRIASLAKCRDKKTTHIAGAVLYGVKGD